jgi:hypothetical protein
MLLNVKSIVMDHVYCSREVEYITEDCAEMILQSMRGAKMAYDALKETEFRKRRREDFEKARIRIVAEAEAKYKREYYKNKYISERVEQYKANYNRYNRPSTVTYFDWDVKPWDNGCKVFKPEMDVEDIRRVLAKDLMEGNKYVINAKGWSIVIEPHSRPYIKLHLSEQLEAEWKADEERLARSIERFYSGSNYWGD